MKNSRLEIGRIVNTHGLRGEVKVTPWCDSPEVFERIDHLYDALGTVFEVLGVKYHKGSVILSLKNINHINSAELLKNKILFVDREALADLPDGVYYIQDLIGLCVITDTGKELGELIDCFPTGSNDVYVVKPKVGKDILLPAIPQVIKQVDLQSGKITVTLIEGLIEDED